MIPEGQEAAAMTPESPLPKGKPGFTSRVVRGSLWTLGGQGLLLAATLVATPFVIRFLGTEGYGVLSLINILIGYLSFADMGMGWASTRFASEAHARQDDAGEATIVWTALFMAALPALLVSLILMLISRPLIEQGLRLPQHLQDPAIVALRIAALGFVGRAVAGVINTPELVRLRMDLIALINAATSGGQILLLPVILFLGGGLKGAAAVIASAGILAAILHTLVAMHLLPSLRRPRVDFTLSKPLIRFGGALVVSSLAAIILTNAEKALLPRYASVQALAYYSVAFTLALMLTQAPLAIAQALLPAFSQLQASTDRTPLNTLYLRALRGHLYWIAPSVVVICVAARPFFTIWAGPDFGRESTLPLYLLAIGLVFEVMAYVPHTLIVSLGRTDLIARCHLAVLVPYLIGSAFLISWLGAPGAAIAWSLRAMTTLVLFVFFARRISGFAFSPLPDNIRSYFVALASLLLPVSIAGLLMSSTLVLLASALVSLIAYVVLLYARVLTNEERQHLAGLLRFRGRLAQ